MANSSVIKSFLVELGFATDETALKKFKTGIEDITKGVVRLGTEVAAATTAIVYGVSKWASNLESLYFAAQRTRSTADELKAFGLAAQNFGDSMEGAMGSVEGLASFLRNNPGGGSFLEGWLKTIGLSAHDANGQLKSGVELTKVLGQLFQQQRAHGQTYLSNQIANMLGISERTMLAMSQPGFGTELDKQEARAKGWQRITAAAHRFEIQLRNLKLQFEQTMLGLAGPAMGALQHLMGSFSKLLAHHGKQLVGDLAAAFEWVMAKLGQLLDWLDQHGDRIQSDIQKIFGEFKQSYELVKPALQWVYDMLVKLDAATNGWSTRLLALTATLKLLGAGGIVSGVGALAVGLAKAFSGLIGASVTATAGGLAVDAWAAAGTAFGLAAAGLIGYAVGSIINYFLPENVKRKIGDIEGGAVDWFKHLGSGAGSWFAEELQKYRAFTQPDLQPFDTSAIAARRIGSGHTLNINQKVDVKVSGGSAGNLDPIALSTHLKRMVFDSNAGIVREFSSQTR